MSATWESAAATAATAGTAASTTPRRKPVTITQSNVGDFLQQIDTLVSDCDGVLWFPTSKGMLPNVKEGLESLRAAGKKLFFVTNNSLTSPVAKFDNYGFSVKKDEVVHPALAISRHLNKIGFKKKAFVLGVESFKNELRAAGIKVAPERTGGLIEETLSHMLNAVKDDLEVGAVIVDFDLNFNYVELTNAANYLRRPECLFFVGATEKNMPVAGRLFLGGGYWYRVLEEATSRKAVIIGKPGTMMVDEFLKDVHKFDLKRSVFVGDMLEQDMGIANACGMKKLLVLTGVTQLEHLDTCDPELIPDFVIESIGDFAHLLSQKQPTI